MTETSVNSLAYAFYEYKGTSIGPNVLRYRELQNMTRKALAQEVGISKSYLSNIEKGRSLPSPSVLTKIAFTLDCTPNDLYNTNT